MKKILTLLFISIIFFSCGRENITEEIVTRHEDDSKKECFYYKTNDGAKIKIRETWYYKEGMKYLDGPIVNDKRNGSFETYYKSGKVMSEGTFVDGIREGKATTYHENGAIHYEGYYQNGKECGIWKFYDEEGNLQKEINRDIR